MSKSIIWFIINFQVMIDALQLHFENLLKQLFNFKVQLSITISKIPC